jgi:hypothetical protein
VLSLVEMLGEKILFGGGEDLIDDFVEPRESLRIVVVTLERLTVEVRRAFACRQEPIAACKGRARTREELTEVRIGGSCARGRRARRCVIFGRWR